MIALSVVAVSVAFLTAVVCLVAVLRIRKRVELNWQALQGLVRSLNEYREEMEKWIKS